MSHWLFDLSNEGQRDAKIGKQSLPIHSLFSSLLLLFLPLTLWHILPRSLSATFFLFHPVCPSSHLCFYYFSCHVFQIHFLIRPYIQWDSRSTLCLSAPITLRLSLSPLVYRLPLLWGVAVLSEYSTVTIDSSKCHSTLPQLCMPATKQLPWQSKQ